MRWLPPNDGSSSNGGEYAESDVDHGAASDADPKDGETCVDENGVPGEDVEDRAWPVTEKIPREHYIEQLETFDEAEYTQEDYEDRSTRLLDCVEALWNECWTYLEKDDLCTYSTVSIHTLHTFYNWLLGRQRGKGGRKLRD